MMPNIHLVRQLCTSIMIALLFVTGPATGAPALADRIELGRDLNGDPCVATRNWQSGAGVIKVEQEQPYTITCRGVSSARIQGIVVPPGATQTLAIGRQCSAALPFEVQGVGAVEARQCYDPDLRLAVVEVRSGQKARGLVGAASASALGPMEQALRALSGVPLLVGGQKPLPVSIKLASLAPAPAAPPETATRHEYGAEAALQQGLSLLHRGSHVDASRVLNDALSRLAADAPISTRVELELTAGLADSNISQFDAASQHFRNATAVLAASPASEGAAFLQSKRLTYQALDLVNRRRWADAITVLDSVSKATDPLNDPVYLGQLNQGGHDKSVTSSIAVADAAQLDWLVLEAEKYWTRSVALLALGRTNDSGDALNQAVRYATELQRSVSRGSITWLRAGLQRQQGRIAAQSGKIDVALASYNCAVAALQGAEQPQGSGCILSGDASRAHDVVVSSGPVIAETQLERAGVMALQANVDTAVLLREFGGAVDTLLASGTNNGEVPAALGSYFDLLIKVSATAPSANIDEAYFRALQTVGEPAIARDVARLQNLVTSDGSIGGKVRDRADLERQVTRLRYEIASAGAADSVKLAALEKDRAVAEAALSALNAELGENVQYRALDDQPATISEVRSALKAGDVYLKIAGLRSNLYAIAISADKTAIYQLAANTSQVQAIANTVIASSRSHQDAAGLTHVDPFNVQAAFALFRAVAGPAEAMLTGAQNVIFDPAGPLRNVPLAILVTNKASVERYKAQRNQEVNDYSQVEFLGSKAGVSTALSPRSFIIVRNKVAPSGAPKPFLGLGENAPAPIVSASLAARPVIFGAGCAISYGEWASITNGNRPVSAHEIGVASDALGFPGAPSIIGTAFTDTALQSDSDANQLAQYQVLHFATHGIPETRFDSGTCPTSLPPSLITSMAAPTESGPVSDGLLTFAKVARLRLDANLVVLSACETSSGTSQQTGRLSGQEDSTPTLDGLVRAFLSANARAVLATYWKVPAETESDELIGAFYRTGRTASIGSALREAQLTLIRQPRFSHPYYWGAYFVVGDGSKTMLTGGRVASRNNGP
jgi:CHAT domain-containing protein